MKTNASIMTSNQSILKKTCNLLIIVALFCFTCFFETIKAQGNDSIKGLNNLIKNTTISGQYFLSYNYDDKSDIQQFTLKRGYFTLNTKLNDIFSVRYTQDITLDQEGTDAGNVEMRLKFLYLKTKLHKIGFLKNFSLEVGLVSRPWLSFEQNVNDYRVQGSMFVERNNLTSSADFGLTFSGNFGGELDEEYKKNVNGKEVGKYGGMSIGIYNGGGYHAIEKNSNKVFESRISLRPFPSRMPGLQISHGFIGGKANQSDSIPDVLVNVFMLSSESKYHRLTAQYQTGKGDIDGEYVDENKNSLQNEGYSLFCELKIPKLNFAVFSRYDNFTLYDAEKKEKTTLIAGLTYRFLKNKLLIDYQRDNSDDTIKNFYEIALEIAF